MRKLSRVELTRYRGKADRVAQRDVKRRGVLEKESLGMQQVWIVGVALWGRGTVFYTFLQYLLRVYAQSPLYLPYVSWISVFHFLRCFFPRAIDRLLAVIARLNSEIIREDPGSSTLFYVSQSIRIRLSIRSYSGKWTESCIFLSINSFLAHPQLKQIS